MILVNYFSTNYVINSMKLSLKNIAIALGIAAGAAAAAVITTKSVNKLNSLDEKKSEENKEEVSTSLNEPNDELEDDILYV